MLVSPHCRLADGALFVPNPCVELLLDCRLIELPLADPFQRTVNYLPKLTLCSRPRSDRSLGRSHRDAHFPRFGPIGLLRRFLEALTIGGGIATIPKR